MWSLQSSNKAKAIFIPPPPFHRWRSWCSKTLNSTADKRMSWNLNTRLLISRPLLHHQDTMSSSHLLCGNPFCSILVRMFLVSGERNPVQISLMATAPEGCHGRVKGQLSHRDEGSWGNYTTLGFWLSSLHHPTVSSFLPTHTPIVGLC